MNRSYVISHMYVSLDGKIDGEYMKEEGCDISGEYYDNDIFELGTSMAGGRATTSMYWSKASDDLSPFVNELEDYSDHVLLNKNNHYSVVYDRFGKCYWDNNSASYGGKEMTIIEVLTRKVPKGYPAYLRSLGISYIFVGEEDMDIFVSLKKLYDLFHIEKLVLTGGAIINGVFLEADCLDEVSLVVAPYIDGEKNMRNFVETPKFINTKFVFKEAKPLDDGGVQLRFLRA